MPSNEPSASTSRTKLALAAGLILSLLALFGHLSASFDGRAAERTGASRSNWWTSDQIRKITEKGELLHDSRLSACAPCPSSALDCPAAPQCEDPLSPPSKPASLSTTTQPHCSSSVNQTLVDTYGLHSLRLSQAHTGSSFRVQRVLDKLARGERVTVAVIGGSVSMGHGKAAPPKEGIWHAFVRRWLDDVSVSGAVAVAGAGAKKRSSVVWRMGAKAASGSNYFVWCYPAHIGTDADLILLESAVNDDFTQEFSAFAETLLRSLLSLPNNPAVIYVDSFGQNAISGGRMVQNGADAHNHLAVRYDVPEISLRAAALTEMMARRKADLEEGEQGKGMGNAWWGGDMKHISVLPHKMLGELVVAYLEEQLCEARRGGWEREAREWEDAEGEHDDLPGMDTLGELPSSWTNQAWDAPPPGMLPAPPTCHMALPDDDHSAFKLIPTTNPPAKDWSLYNWKGVKQYYESVIAGSDKIEFTVSLAEGARGEVAVGYLKTASYDIGTARCAVRSKATGKAWPEKVLDGYWDRSISISITEVLASGLAPGEYTVECRTVSRGEQSKGKHAFRIVSVMSM